MSIWSVLGDLGAGVAAPFTGGASLALIPAISALSAASGGGGTNIPSNMSQVMGSAASGMANQANQQSNLATAQGNMSQKNYTDQLNQAIMKAITLPATGAQMAAKGDVQANIQDMTPSFTPGAGYSFSGGLRPSDLGPNARTAGQNMSNAGVSAQSMQLPSMWQMPNFPSTTPSAGQQALQYGALGTGILGALQPSPLQQLLQKMGSQQNANPGTAPGFVNGGTPDLTDPNDPNTINPLTGYGG
jgi:hypothetical protein